MKWSHAQFVFTILLSTTLGLAPTHHLYCKSLPNTSFVGFDSSLGIFTVSGTINSIEKFDILKSVTVFILKNCITHVLELQVAVNVISLYHAVDNIVPLKAVPHKLALKLEIKFLNLD